MSRLLSVLCCFILVSIKIQAQERSDIGKKYSKYQVNLSYVLQEYFNRGGVHNDGNYPDVLTAKNTSGHVIGVTLQRQCGKRMLLEGGFLYGQQKHDVTVNYSNLDFFDTLNKERLSVTNFRNNYTATVSYVGLNFMAGYQHPLLVSKLRGLQIEAKAGFSCRISVTENHSEKAWRLMYDRNDSTYLTSFGEDFVYFGKASSWGSFVLSYDANLYLGLKQKIDNPFLKNASFGVFVTHSGFGKDWGGIGYVESRSRNFSGKVVSRDVYRSQDFSVGLKLSIGLWCH